MGKFKVEVYDFPRQEIEAENVEKSAAKRSMNGMQCNHFFGRAQPALCPNILVLQKYTRHTSARLPSF